MCNIVLNFFKQRHHNVEDTLISNKLTKSWIEGLERERVKIIQMSLG